MRFKPKMAPKGTPKSTQNRSKNASEKSSKKGRWFAARWRVRPGQQAGGTESAFFGKLDAPLLHLNCAFPQICHVSYLRSGLLPLPATATDTLLLLLAAFCCCLLLPAAAYCFVYFSRFQPDLPEPIQNAWFSCHLLLFLAISCYFLPFPACHAVSCNFL